MFGHLQELFQLEYSSFDVGVSNEYYMGVLLRWWMGTKEKKNMFENAINSKEQGDIGMCYAMAYFSKIGYTVSVPITNSQDYDLLQ